MKGTVPLVGAAVVVVVVAVFLFSSAYRVSEAQWAVVTQFGKPVRVVPERDAETGEMLTTPGLYWKTPFIQDVTRMDRRAQSWDGEPTSIPTRDKKYIEVDTFARWRIVRPRDFFESNQGRIEFGHRKLDDIVESAVRDVIGSQNLIEVVRATNRQLLYETEELTSEQRERAEKISKGRQQIEVDIARKATEKLDPKLGIELVDVRIKRVNYVGETRARIYARMKSERERIAKKFISEAQEESSKILGQTNAELAEITGEAVGRSAEIKGEADAEVIRIYGEAIAKTREFYSFLRTLEAYRKSIDSRTTLLLSTDTDFLRFLKSMDGK